MIAEQCSGRTLAFLGDAVWSLIVRRWLIEQGEGSGKVLQTKAAAFVSARAQASFYDRLHEQGFFTEEEEAAFRHGRNANAGTVPHHTPVQIYRKSTGFEAMIGTLEMEGKRERIEEIWQEIGKLSEMEP